MTTYRARLCAVAVFVALLAGACGSGGDDGRLTGAKGAYAAQIDPICKQLRGKLGELGDKPEQQAKDVEEAVGRMKAVPVPANDDQRAKLFIAAMENLYISLQDVDQSRRVNDQTRATKALATARINSETAAKAAKSYGMVECAEKL